MSPIVPPQRLASRSAIVGEDTPIARALPHRVRRTVGAWCFLDHAGPVQFAPGAGMHVGAHPHIGLQTFTWMIEGEIMHRDSLGNEQVIRPGQVNLMTAGAASPTPRTRCATASACTPRNGESPCPRPSAAVRRRSRTTLNCRRSTPAAFAPPCWPAAHWAMARPPPSTPRWSAST